MNKISLVRKIASALLLLCFVLPLSECTYTDKSGVASKNTFYAYVWVCALAKDVVALKANPLESVGAIFMYLTTFIFPILYVFLKPLPQSIITILSSMSASYVLYINMFSFSPLIGSWLTLISWITLVIISLLSIWWHLPHNKQRRRTCSAPLL